MPEHIRIGTIEVTIWENENNGRTFNNVTVQRNYKNKTGAWAKTQNLRVDDIPKVILGLQEAYKALTIKE